MSPFIPHQYVRLSLATIFALAKLLEFETNLPADMERAEMKLLLSGSTDWQDARRFRVARVVYKIREFDGDDPSAVEMELRELTSSQDEPFIFHLEPPFDTCIDRAFPFLNGEPIEGRWRFPPLVGDVPSQIRHVLAEGILTGSVVEESGHITNIPVEFWRTSDGWLVINKGERVALLIDGRLVKGEALVKHAQFRKLLAPVSIKDPQPFVEEKKPDFPDYIPPFLAFMMRAVRGLGLTPDKRMSRVQVADWIRENWSTPDLGEITEHKVYSMVTFLRRPEDGKGGNLKS